MSLSATRLELDPNHHPVIGGVADDGSGDIIGALINVKTGELYTTGAGGLDVPTYDAMTYTATSPTVGTYLYYVGGTGGNLVATVTITYTDATQTVLVSIVRT
jgi:hypothetical protein